MRAHDRGALTADVLTVYPTALKAGQVLRARARAAGCLLGAHVTTFPELTDALARDLDVSPRLLEPEMAAVVLAHALAHTPLPEAWRTPRRGLLRECLRVVAELKSAYLTPDDVTEIAAAAPAAVGERLATLARVYAAYERALRRLDAVDRHGRDWLVCERLAEAAARGVRPRMLAGLRRVVFAEIYDFSVLQFLIASSLIRLIGDAELVAFASPENVDATRFLDRTWNRFVGDPAIADQALPSFVERGGRQGSLAAALRGVFARERPAPPPPDGSIRLVVAPSRYREVEAAVCDVRRRLEAGADAEQIAILARDLSLYGDLIEDVCRRYRVPVYFRKGKPLVANGYVKACLNLLRCVTEGFPRARLEALFDGDYLDRPRPHLVRALRDVGFVAEGVHPLADCVVRRAARLAAEASAGSTPEEREAAARRGHALARDGAALAALIATLRALDAHRTIADHVRALDRCLRRLRARPVARDDTAPAAARRDARAAERFHETLALFAGVTRALGDGPMPLVEFVRRLVAALEPQEVEDRAEAAGSVRALSILDARGLHFDAVYLLGLDDGTFPAPRAESPLWPDVMKRLANPLAATVLRRKLGARAAGLPLGGLLRTAREASLEDPFLFFLALSMAERALIVSYPATNERGNPTVASPFLDELRACCDGPLPETVLEPTEIVPRPEDCGEPAELVARAALARWARTRGAAPDRLGPALAAAMPALAERNAAIDRRAEVEERRSRYFLCPRGDPEKAGLADAWVGRLSPELGVLPGHLGAMAWSPSRLETLAGCGFRFFARYVLGLGVTAEPEAEVGRAERGTLAHRALEAFFRAHPRLPADLDAARTLGREFLARWRDEVTGAIAPKEPALLDVSWQQVAAAVDAVIALEHDEQPRLAAGGIVVDRLLEEPLPASLVDSAGGPPILLTGTADRIDIHRRQGVAAGLRVLDYKMSRTTARYARLADPERELGRSGFQIPVYLLGALAAVPDLAPDAALEGGYLVLLASDKPWQGYPLTRDLLDGERVAGRIAALVAAARAGRFDVDPDPCDPYCPYRAACRYQKPPLEEELTGG